MKRQRNEVVRQELLVEDLILYLEIPPQSWLEKNKKVHYSGYYKCNETTNSFLYVNSYLLKF